MYVTGVVLAAGASRRLGSPKQLLPYRGRPLLDSTLRMARECGFQQLMVTLGAAAEQVREQVDLSGVRVVDSLGFADGCGSSIRSAIAQVEQRSQGVVLLLGDQPGIDPATVRALVEQATESSIGICRYLDGPGHPFWFGRALFTQLAGMHGDKAVWKLLESKQFPVTEHSVDELQPRDVDTWADYQALISRPLTAESR
jgi:molybdenum cofactor cytidylyltransferase